jgi:hypothetical protein
VFITSSAALIASAIALSRSLPVFRFGASAICAPFRITADYFCTY